jgi:hypothetical protein
MYFVAACTDGFQVMVTLTGSDDLIPEPKMEALRAQFPGDKHKRGDYGLLAAMAIREAVAALSKDGWGVWAKSLHLPKPSGWTCRWEEQGNGNPHAHVLISFDRPLTAAERESVMCGVLRPADGSELARTLRRVMIHQHTVTCMNEDGDCRMNMPREFCGQLFCENGHWYAPGSAYDQNLVTHSPGTVNCLNSHAHSQLVAVWFPNNLAYCMKYASKAEIKVNTQRKSADSDEMENCRQFGQSAGAAYCRYTDSPCAGLLITSSRSP